MNEEGDLSLPLGRRSGLTMNTMVATANREPAPALITLVHVTYGLHALGLAIGAFGTATILGSFLFGWPSIIAVIINYVKRSEASGTWLESHFSWQIRTFWYALLWAYNCVRRQCWRSCSWGLRFDRGMFALGVWSIYRITRGWLALRDGKAISA
jgi:uncharacterized membrane protein